MTAVQTLTPAPIEPVALTVQLATTVACFNKSQVEVLAQRPGSVERDPEYSIERGKICVALFA